MIKKSKKIISIVLALMMVISCFTVLTVNAATTDEVTSSALASVYQTNPNGAKGKNATISIDGSFSDWTADMKIAQSGAWDVANNWKGAHENCVLDTTGLYAAWDNENLYVAWQMVNITDTFWREGDGPLSDGGRVLDVPLILALSVDPSSTSLTNQVVGESKKIWGVDIGFDTHVDHLFYMSGKVGNGTPAMFTAADSTGATNYTTACKNYKDAGIKYALAEGNIESSIIGLDGSQSPDDVTSDASNWVDFKTHQGSYGVHNTKYDSFYEMSIPLSALGIDANYLNSNGIGAMIVASRGESGLDCTPYDMCMIDNATGDYGSDASTSHEKDDSDVITSAFARIGGSGTPVVPTTKPVEDPTEAPTTKPVVDPTVAPTTQPDDEPTNTLDVNVTSNLCNTVSKTYSADEKTVTVTANLESSNRIVDGEIYIKYDPTKLKISASNYDEDENPCITPTITAVGGEIVNMNYADDTICVTFTNTKKYNFTTSKPLVQVTFDVIGTGSTNVDINVEELDCALSGSNTPVILVKDGVPADLYNTTCKTTTSLTDPTVEPPTKPQPTEAPTTIPDETDPDGPETLNVKATSNLANAVSDVYGTSDTVTVTYNLESSNKIVDGEIYIKYDPTKLKISASNYDEDENPCITPTITAVGGEIVNMNYAEDTICVTFTNTKKYNFTTKAPLVSVTFDIIGSGDTTVHMDVAELDCVLSGSNLPVILVKDSAPVELYETTCKSELVLSAPAPLPSDPTLGENDIKVIAKSNIAQRQTQIYSTISNKQVTVTYMLQADQKFNAGEWRLTYDPAMLKFASANYDADGNVKVMPVADGKGVTVSNLPEEGRLRGTFGHHTNIYDFTTQGKLVEVTFDIVGKGTTTVNLIMDNLGYLNDNNEAIKMVEDSNIAPAYKATGTVELSDAIPEDGTLPATTEPTTVPPTSDPTSEPTTVPPTTTEPTSEPTQPTDPVSTLLGDVDLDGLVTIKDATLVQEHVAKYRVLTGQAAINADVDLSGDINIIDASNIQMVVSKLMKDFV